MELAMTDKTPAPSAPKALYQSPLHQAMHEQMRDGSLFTRAIEHGQAYLRGVSDRPVDPDAAAQAALAGLDGPLPEGPGEAEAILDRLARLGGPATTAQVGGRFFGMVNGGLLPAALAARLLADTWDQNAVVHAVSPTNSRLEEVCQRWLVELLGLPQQTVAGFVSGTSMAIVCGLAAARWRLCQRLGCDINAAGLAAAPRLRLITSRHAHSTVLKGVALLGFGTDTIEYAEVDDQGRLRPETLPALDETCILILQAGNVNSGSFDPIRACCERAQSAGAWVHIDGAFGLWAAACPNLAYLTDGLALAQSSLVVDFGIFDGIRAEAQQGHGLEHGRMRVAACDQPQARRRRQPGGVDVTAQPLAQPPACSGKTADDGHGRAADKACYGLLRQPQQLDQPALADLLKAAIGR